MNTNLRPLLRVALTSAVLLAATPSHAESVATLGADSGGGGSASASVRIRLVVVPVLRLLENKQASWSETPDNSNKLVSQQKLVVMSNLPQGFCVALRQTNAQGHRWQLRALQTDGAQLAPTADGYKLCGTRPGRYNLVVEHELERDTSALQTASAPIWPVQTELTSL